MTTYYEKKKEVLKERAAKYYKENKAVILDKRRNKIKISKSCVSEETVNKFLEHLDEEYLKDNKNFYIMQREYEGTPLLLCKRSNKTLYNINLMTMKPTINSNCQKPLTDELIKLIKYLLIKDIYGNIL